MSAAPPVCEHIVMLGLMASGKTTVGALLAARLGVALRDSDEQIRAREGASVRELQDRFGAAWLHALEAEVLLEALARDDRAVVCAAASTVEDERCRAALREPAVTAVWLRASLATIVARYDSDPHRPRYAQGTAAALREQLASRAGRFAQLASISVDVDGLAPAAVEAAILAAIGGRGGSPD
jgi:shikimate kinase